MDEDDEGVPEGWERIFPEYAAASEAGSTARMPEARSAEYREPGERPEVSWDGWVNAAGPGDGDYSDEELHEALFGDTAFGGSG